MAAPQPAAASARGWPARLLALAACLGGGLAAIATLGPRILDIHDLGWLLHGTLGPDPVAYLVAWQYFAPAPWSWPPGLNPAYGMELSSAIFYVDAVPLAAILAKALRPLLEIPQYWGPWMVLCAALQAARAGRGRAGGGDAPPARPVLDRGGTALPAHPRRAFHQLRRALGTDRAPGRTLYVLRDEAMRRLVAARADPLRDLLAQRDGLWVFAPGWLRGPARP
ncbi:DUF6311 domain-containing protein [Falsiroseomonas sp. E2-1-a20]|uniref:DUF6311 domain-containing protein n=1 Tax=Falsiroseomonas sp. E2-1-a20 TaxID=3239300 RepID=UPI003F3F952F